jgi:hypothetical protein
MRRADREVTDPQELEAIIRAAPYCTLALCRDGAPYAVPLSFGYDGVCVYFHCATEGLKLDILRQNPRVSLCFVGRCEVIVSTPACASSARYASVLMTGTARLVEDVTEKAVALDAIMAQHGAEGPQSYDERDLARTQLVAVDIASMTGKRHD